MSFLRWPVCHAYNKRKQKFCPWALFLVVRTNLIPEHKSSGPLPSYLQPRLASHVTRAFRTTIADAYFRNKTESGSPDRFFKYNGRLVFSESRTLACTATPTAFSQRMENKSLNFQRRGKKVAIAGVARGALNNQGERREYVCLNRGTFRAKQLQA